MLFLELAVGLAVLVAGGDLLVRGAAALARHLGVAPRLIGLTVVGFATSMPELVTSLAAALAGSPGIAVGNVVGSNIANILLILGLAALIRPLATARDSFLSDGLGVVFVSLIGAAVALYGSLNRLVGLALVLLLIIYVANAVRRAGSSSSADGCESRDVNPLQAGRRGQAIAIVLSLAGLGLSLVGAKLLVDGAIDLARSLQVDDAVIGLTIVAVGTSLPELAASVMAAVQRKPDIAIGNIIGSNIFNVLGILGVTALVRPIAMDAAIAQLDIWVMLAAAVLLLAAGLSGSRLSRGEGGVFLVLYAAYLAVLVYRI